MFLYNLIQKLKIIKRFNKILIVFLGAGFGAAIKSFGLHRHIRPWQKLGRTKASESELPQKLKEALIKLGPVFVKFGQILSTRSDLLPKEYILALETLQAKVPPFPFFQAEEILEKHFNQPIKAVFAKFEKLPFASASLGQVYKAKLKSGENVAVKVQRPGAKEQIKLDTQVLLMLAHWIDKRFPDSKGLNLISLVQEFRRWTLNELDYRKEAANCEIFSNFFKDDSNIYGPKVFWDYSGDCVLTLEFVEGQSLGDLLASPSTALAKTENKKLAHHIADSFIRQFFEYGYFHADPHPGNIFILPKGKIMFLDFGMVGFLDQRLTGLAAALFLAVIQKDTETIVGLLGQIEEKYDDRNNNPSPVNTNAMRKELNEMLLQWSVKTGQGGQFTKLMSELLKTAVKNGVNIPTDLSMLGKSIATLDVVVKQLDSNFQMEKWELPMVEKIMTRKLKTENFTTLAKTSTFVMEDLIKKLPQSTATVVENLEKGRFGMEINTDQLLQYEQLLNANSKMNNYVTLLAAIAVASALIYQVKGQPEFFGLSLAQLGLYSSLILVAFYFLKNFGKTV